MKKSPNSLIILATITLLTACKEASLAGPGEGETATPQVTATVTPTSGAEESTFTSPVSVATAVQGITPTPEISTPTISPTLVNTSALTTSAPIQIVEIKPLTYDHSTPAGQELETLLTAQAEWSAVYEKDGPFDLLGWTATGEIVVQPVLPNTTQFERPVWTININTGQAASTPNLSLEPILTGVQSQIRDDFLRGWAGKPEMVRPYPAPTGQSLALLALDEDKTQSRLYVYLGENEAPIILPEARTGDSYRPSAFPPAWSPDGKKLAYGVVIDEISPEFHELHISDLETKTNIVVTPIYSRGNPKGIAWSPDGQYIVFSAQRSEQAPLSLFAVKADGTGLNNLTPDSQLWAIYPLFWSPDGKHLAFGDGRGGEVWLAEITIE